MNSLQSSPYWSQQPDFDAPALPPIPLTTQEKALRNIFRDKGYLYTEGRDLQARSRQWDPFMSSKDGTGKDRCVSSPLSPTFLSVCPRTHQYHHTHFVELSASWETRLAGTEGFWEILMCFVAISKSCSRPAWLLKPCWKHMWRSHRITTYTCPCGYSM